MKTNALMRRFRLNPTAIEEDRDLIARALLAEEDHPIRAALRQHRPAYEGALSRLLEALTAASGQSSLERATERFRQDALRRLERLEREALFADIQRRRAAEARLARIRACIMPNNKPQERVLSVFSFLFEHGWSLVDRMIDELKMEDFGLQEIEL